MTIQTQVLSVARCYPPGYDFHIENLSIEAAQRFRLNLPYSYKQVRNALYRLRVGGQVIKHNGRGWYCWDVR